MAFEREQDPSRKRQRAGCTKMYSTFRADMYQQHLSRVHPIRWAQYNSIQDSQVKAQYFSTSPASRLTSHFCELPSISFTVSPSIVDDIIGGMMFHPDDAESVTQNRAMRLYSKSDTGHYVARITNICIHSC